MGVYVGEFQRAIQRVQNNIERTDLILLVLSYIVNIYLSEKLWTRPSISAVENGSSRLRLQLKTSVID